MLLEMSEKEFLVSFAFIACFSYIVGWFCDRILDKAGYGHIGNWLLVFAGTYAGLYGLTQYGYELHWFPMHTLAAALGGAFVMLFTMCLLKRFSIT